RRVGYRRPPSGRPRAAPWRAGYRPRAARRVRFRVRVPDGAHESAPQRENRHRVHDARRAVHLHQLTSHQGSLRTRRPRARPRAGHGGSEVARQACQAANRRRQKVSLTGGTMGRLAERTTRITSSPTMAITATVDRLRRTGVEIVDFGAGEPDFTTPEP